MNIEYNINVIAGRPGAGKTIWAAREAVSDLRDENNVVVYVGHMQEIERIRRMILDQYGHGPRGKFLFATPDESGSAIGRAIDIANSETGVLTSSEEAENASRQVVYLIYDQCRHDLFPGRRDLLKAAAKAGVHVIVLCQKYGQIDRGDIDWLNQNCSALVISKSRTPRNATDVEVRKTYR